MTLAELARRFGMSPLRMHRLLEPFVAAGLVGCSGADYVVTDRQFARAFLECRTGIPLAPGDTTGLERTPRDSRGGRLAA